MTTRLNTIDDYARRIESGNRFAVARYGDGEWGAILGKIDRTCYGDVVTPELRDAITNTLLSPKSYFYASLGEPWTAEVNEWCQRQQIKCNWVKKQVLEQASRDGRLLGFLQSIKSRRSLAVGLPRLSKLQEILGSEHVEVIGPNCFGGLEHIVWNVREAVRLFKPEVILIACGLTSVVLVHELFDQVDATLIDVGALFDPFCGVESRRGHKSTEHREFVRKTLEALADDKDGGCRQQIPQTLESGIDPVLQSVDADVSQAAQTSPATILGSDGSGTTEGGTRT